MQHLENFQSSRKTFICCLPSSPSSLFLLVEVVVLCTNTLHTKGLLHYALCFLKTLKLTETNKLLNEETLLYNAMLDEATMSPFMNLSRVLAKLAEGQKGHFVDSSITLFTRLAKVFVCCL